MYNEIKLPNQNTNLITSIMSEEAKWSFDLLPFLGRGDGKEEYGTDTPPPFFRGEMGGKFSA